MLLYVIPDDQIPVPMGIIDILQWIFFVFLFLFFLVIIISLLIPKRENLSRWNVLIHGLHYSSKEYYDKLELVLKTENVEGLKFTTKNLSTGGILSSRRLYAHISYDGFVYEVCAAPFGNSFFISYWMSGADNKLKNGIARIPLFGKHVVNIFFPETYYRVDTCNMFHTLLHDTIIALTDEIAEKNDAQKLSENQKIPVMKDIFKR